jgi:hypothetical protein
LHKFYKRNIYKRKKKKKKKEEEKKKKKKKKKEEEERRRKEPREAGTFALFLLRIDRSLLLLSAIAA